MTHPLHPADIAALERIEAAAWADIYRSHPASSPYRLDTSSEPHGPVLFGLTSIPWTEFNKALGVEPGATLDGPGIAAIKQWMRTNAAPSWALQVPEPALDDALRDQLREAGLESKGHGTAKLSLDADQRETEAETMYDIRPVPSDRRTDFAHTVQLAFGGPAVLAETFLALPGRMNWRTYVAYEGDLPVACGALFIQGSFGWVGIGGTRPEFRAKGAQSALIQRRIQDGRAAGVKTFVVEAGAPRPGFENKAVSFNNLVRAGFKHAYTRSNFGPAEAV